MEDILEEDSKFIVPKSAFSRHGSIGGKKNSRKSPGRSARYSNYSKRAAAKKQISPTIKIEKPENDEN